MSYPYPTEFREFRYSTHPTKEAAELALEDYFATGEVLEPELSRIRVNRDGRYDVMLRNIF